MIFRHIHRDMSHRLYGIRVEQNTLFSADRADLTDRHHGADLVVGVHHAHKAGILPDGVRHLLCSDHAVFVHVQQLHLKSLFFQFFQRMQHRMMLKSGRNDMLFALAFAQCRRGKERLIIRLTAAGGEINLLRGSSQQRCDLLACSGQRLIGTLSGRMQAGGISKDLIHIRQHRLYCMTAHFGGCRIICIN